MHCWYPDITKLAEAINNGFAARHGYIIKTADPKGSFSFGLQLEDICGFCEDYTKVVYGMRHSLKMVRKSDDDAIFKADAADAGKVKLTKITWMMPRVKPNDVKKFNLYITIRV